MTRTHRRLAVVTGLAVLLLSGCGEGQLRPGAAALVGDERITTEALQATTEEALADPQARERLGTDLPAFQRQVLSRLVKRQVLDEAARSLGVTVSDGEVSEQLETFVQGAGSREVLEQQAAQGGVSADELEPFVRDLVLEQKLGDELVEDLDVPQARLQAIYQDSINEYDRVRSRHILVPDEALARQILARVQKDLGVFAAQAAQFSTDTSNKDSGGDLGLAPRGQFVPAFEELIFALPEGGTGLVQTEFGWHVVNVVERQTTTLAEATPELRRRVLQAEVESRTAELLRETADRLGVTVNPRFGVWNAEAVEVQPDTEGGGVRVVPSAEPTLEGEPAPTS